MGGMVVVDDVWTEFVKRRDQGLREKLILQYAPLVRYVIDRLAISFPAVMDSDDVHNSGVIGLIHAIDRFDPERGVKFETYAINRVRGAIIDELRGLDPVPRSTRARAKQIEQAHVELEGKLGRLPSEEEVAEHLGIDVERLNELMLQLCSVTVSLDSSYETDDGSETMTLAELVQDEASPNPAQLLERKELVETLTRVIGQLPPREKLVLALYYYEELTLREISKVMDLSESRVCQLHTQAILRLRALLKRGIGGS